MPSRATTIVLTCALVLFRNSTQTSNRPVEETVVIVLRGGFPRVPLTRPRQGRIQDVDVVAAQHHRQAISTHARLRSKREPAHVVAKKILPS
jgi:hypothetical protein